MSWEIRCQVHTLLVLVSLFDGMEYRMIYYLNYIVLFVSTESKFVQTYMSDQKLNYLTFT